MYQAIVIGIAALLSLALLLIFKKTEDDKFRQILGAVVIIYCALGFFRGFLSDSFLYVINGGWFENVFFEKTDVLQTVLRWGYGLCYAALPVAVFYKSRFFKNLASYVCLPFALLSAIYFDDFMAYFLDPTNSHGYDLTPGVRYALFIAELVLAISIPVVMQVRERHVLRVRDLGEVLGLLVGAPLAFLIAVPVYAPQSLFGYTILIPEAYSSFHLIWMSLILVVCLGVYYGFRFKSREERIALCMFLALLLFFQRNSIYLMGLNIKRLPLQLCNIAAYFYLIALVFNMKKLFHFAFIGNVVGALIAILMPDFSHGSVSFWNMHYLIEHAFVIIVPCAVMGLRIFPRLEKSSLKYLWIGFTSYFVLIFIAGTILNGYSDVTGETVNYFYMFDMETALDFFPFLTFAENTVWELGRFSCYPIIVGLIYVLFSLLCFVFYLFINFCYKLEDDHLALRGSSIDLYEKLSGKTSRRPKAFIE